MATRTRAELVNQALANLGVTDPNEIASAEDYKAVNDHFDTAMAQLSGEDIFTLADEDDIPLELFGPLADYLAEDSASDFGRAANQQAVQLAKARIRTITRNRPTYQTLASDYF
jgi:hypothetical protein